MIVRCIEWSYLRHTNPVSSLQSNRKSLGAFRLWDFKCNTNLLFNNFTTVYTPVCAIFDIMLGRVTHRCVCSIETKFRRLSVIYWTESQTGQVKPVKCCNAQVSWPRVRSDGRLPWNSGKTNNNDRQFLLSISFNNQCNLPDGSHTGIRTHLGVSRLRNKNANHTPVFDPSCVLDKKI